MESKVPGAKGSFVPIGRSSTWGRDMFENLFGGKKAAPPGVPSKSKEKPDGGPKGHATFSPAKLRRENLKRRFTILAETGQGSMSRVYRAMDNKSGRTACLKVQDKEKTSAALARSAKIGRPTEGEIGMRMAHPQSSALTSSASRARANTTSSWTSSRGSA